VKFVTVFDFHQYQYHQRMLVFPPDGSWKMADRMLIAALLSALLKTHLTEVERNYINLQDDGRRPPHVSGHSTRIRARC
jgi:hypothetical protein